MTRWRTMIEALNALPAAPERQSTLDLILGELKHPDQVEQAGLLAPAIHDRQLQAELLLRQADLFVLRSNARSAADIGWGLYIQRQLPTDRFDWFIERLRAAREYGRLIQFVEDGLRSDKTLSNGQLDALAAAYDALGRTDDADRARTNPRMKKP